MVDTFTQIRRPERTFTSRSKFGISRCLSARHRTLQFSACISQPRGPRPYRRFGSVLWSASAAVYPNSFSAALFHEQISSSSESTNAASEVPSSRSNSSCSSTVGLLWQKNQCQGEVRFVSDFERLKFACRLSQSVRGNAERWCGSFKKQAHLLSSQL